MNSQDKATRCRPSFLATASDFDHKNWIKTGLLWGLFMFLVGSIGFPYFNGQEITWKSVLLGIVIWTIGGLGFGYTMKFIWKKIINKNGKNTAAGKL
jgi:preprotein translocase subunit Sss1